MNPSQASSLFSVQDTAFCSVFNAWLEFLLFPIRLWYRSLAVNAHSVVLTIEAVGSVHRPVSPCVFIVKGPSWRDQNSGVTWTASPLMCDHNLNWGVGRLYRDFPLTTVQIFAYCLVFVRRMAWSPILKRICFLFVVIKRSVSWLLLSACLRNISYHLRCTVASRWNGKCIVMNDGYSAAQYHMYRNPRGLCLTPSGWPMAL